MVTIAGCGSTSEDPHGVDSQATAEDSTEAGGATAETATPEETATPMETSTPEQSAEAERNADDVASMLEDLDVDELEFEEFRENQRDDEGRSIRGP